MLPIHREVAKKVDQLELPFNQFGVDPYGVSKRHLRLVLSSLGWMYRHYFDVHVLGIEQVPARGRAMLIGNHSGGVALDAAMVLTSMVLAKDPPRLAQGMAEKFLNRVPFVSKFANRTGQFTGLPEHARRLLRDDRLLMVFPEGARGTAKLYGERYSLVKFGTGFMRLALQTNTPIVPLAFLGGGEAVPTIHNATFLGKLIGAPYVPITPYGVLLPLPVRLDLIYGKPMEFAGTGNEDDETIHRYVDEVKAEVARLIAAGRKIRSGMSPTKALGGTR